MTGARGPDVFSLQAYGSQDPVLADDHGSGWLNAADARQLIGLWQHQFVGPKKLVFHYIRNTSSHVAALLGLLQAGHAVALLDPLMPADRQRQLEQIYLPHIVLNPSGVDTVVVRSVPLWQSPQVDTVLHSDLALLLSTSGSTGSPKFVRLSLNAITENATSIAKVLDIQAEEVGLGHLALHYSYGLSVLSSHLAVGAPVLLTERGFMDREFWHRAKNMRAAHLPGVPFHYQTLRRLGLTNIDLPDLRVMTQAGGALDATTRKLMHSFMAARNGRFHVMYGQTEAAPRISTLTHEDFVHFPDSVGTALPSGQLFICDENGNVVETDVVGEVIYHGPNVMMGYAQERAELALGDSQNGKLHTGDLGRIDAKGRLTLTGRIKRFAKIAGLRISLDDIEKAAAPFAQEVAAIQKGENILIYCGRSDDDDVRKVAILEKLGSLFTIPRVAYRMMFIETIPRTAAEKIDYKALEKL